MKTENGEEKRAWYTPAGFAALFGMERTWAYRLLYAGKIQAITGYGNTRIPQSEVDKMLNDTGRYLGRRGRKPKTEGGAA